MKEFKIMIHQCVETMLYVSFTIDNEYIQEKGERWNKLIIDASDVFPLNEVRETISPFEDERYLLKIGFVTYRDVKSPPLKWTQIPLVIRYLYDFIIDDREKGFLVNRLLIGIATMMNKELKLVRSESDFVVYSTMV